MITTSDITQSSGKKANIRFGELLLSKGLLNRRELTEALNEQRNRGGRLGEILVKLKMVSDEDVRCALAEHLATERVHLDGKDIDMGPQMPTAPNNLTNAVQNNFDFWADNADQLNERFNAWLASN